MENLKRFLAFVAVIAVFNGLGLLLVPAVVLATYGIEPSPGALLGFRLLGLTLIEFGIINWLLRSSHDWATLRGLLIGGTVGSVLGVIITIWATLSHVTNPAGWLLVVTYAILLLGYVISLWGSRKFAAS